MPIRRDMRLRRQCDQNLALFAASTVRALTLATLHSLPDDDDACHLLIFLSFFLPPSVRCLPVGINLEKKRKKRGRKEKEGSVRPSNSSNSSLLCLFSPLRAAKHSKRQISVTGKMPNTIYAQGTCQSTSYDPKKVSANQPLGTHLKCQAGNPARSLPSLPLFCLDQQL